MHVFVPRSFNVSVCCFAPTDGSVAVMIAEIKCESFWILLLLFRNLISTNTFCKCCLIFLFSISVKNRLVPYQKRCYWSLSINLYVPIESNKSKTRINTIIVHLLYLSDVYENKRTNAMYHVIIKHLTHFITICNQIWTFKVQLC